MCRKYRFRCVANRRTLRGKERKIMKRCLSIIIALCMIMSVMPAISLTAFAADSVTYLDADGNTKTASATLVTSSDTAWSDGWYYADGEITLSSIVTVSGEVHLILCDGATLTASSGINVADGNSFYIYAQSTGESMGAVKATGSIYCPGIGGFAGGGCVTINGGTVETTGGDCSAGIGGGYK